VWQAETDRKTDGQTDRIAVTSTLLAMPALRRAAKKKSSLFEPPFGKLRGNVCTSSITCWKARVRLPIRRN